MSENRIGGQQSDYGFQKFLDQEGRDYKISQRAEHGLTLVELKGPRNIDVVLSDGKITGVRERIPPGTVNAVVLGKDIRTYRRLTVEEVLVVGIHNGVDYLSREYVLDKDDEKTFKALLNFSDWPWIGVFYVTRDGAGFLPYLKLNTPSFKVNSSIGINPEINRAWTGEERELPTSYEGKVYSLSKDSGIVTVRVEAPEDTMEISFPEFIGQRDLRELDALLKTDDAGWFDLPTAKPILHYSRTPKER